MLGSLCLALLPGGEGEAPEERERIRGLLEAGIGESWKARLSCMAGLAARSISKLMFWAAALTARAGLAFLGSTPCNASTGPHSLPGRLYVASTSIAGRLLGESVARRVALGGRGRITIPGPEAFMHRTVAGAGHFQVVWEAQMPIERWVREGFARSCSYAGRVGEASYYVCGEILASVEVLSDTLVIEYGPTARELPRITSKWYRLLATRLEAQGFEVAWMPARSCAASALSIYEKSGGVEAVEGLLRRCFRECRDVLWSIAVEADEPAKARRAIEAIEEYKSFFGNLDEPYYDIVAEAEDEIDMCFDGYSEDECKLAHAMVLCAYTVQLKRLVETIKGYEARPAR